ncbi:MAG: bifunctional phosphoglucose/phosphomannose isomerase [Anaerolineae bacterium]|nr:bifunctional phosphoglucose/phosphomannose isomerase [Anaerolineae bacterium]MDW8069400.1 bifunctional phosphoglucose/phosphomannose isomerase [Anaerolineae bacterium]
MVNLDDPKLYEEQDPQRMRDRIAELPVHCVDAWRLVQDLVLPEEYRRVRQVIVLGMGGSAIGGALAAALVADECPVPVLGIGGYDLPAHAGPETLVIGSSYSGNTEETLSAFAQALERGCRLVAIATGGQLATIAEEKRIPFLRFTPCLAPRAAIGYSLVLLLGILWRAGLIQDPGNELDEAVAVLKNWQQELRPEVPTVRNPAKRLAGQLVGRLPVIYGAGFLAPVARRWKGQFNENAKQWALWEEMPELNHNAVVGLGLPDAIRGQVSVVMLRSTLDHPRVQARWEITKALLLHEGIAPDEIWGQGESHLAQMLSLIHFGDYVSLYLALLNGTDPTPVKPIDYLKEQLARRD